VTFIALDVAQGDLGEDYTVPSNVYCAAYQEELCGYMAGYAAVKLGYTHLGVLGGMAVPAVQRFGYGFVQGADAAAVEMGISDQVVMEYAYGNQFYGDSDITAYMDNWYQTLGVEVVFASGGGIYTSAAEAAAKVGGKLIGVDVDQSANIDTYGEGMCVTSAMKGLAETVKHMLGEVVAGNFANYGGQVETLGLVNGDDPTANYVQLPMETTQWGDCVTQDDYKTLAVFSQQRVDLAPLQLERDVVVCDNSRKALVGRKRRRKVHADERAVRPVPAGGGRHHKRRPVCSGPPRT